MVRSLPDVARADFWRGRGLLWEALRGAVQVVSSGLLETPPTMCSAKRSIVWPCCCAKRVSFGLSRLCWRAQSSSRSSLSTRLRPFISSVAHTPSRKYALWSSFGHASLGNSKPAVSQRRSNRSSKTCSWTRCVYMGGKGLRKAVGFGPGFCLA